MTKRSVEAKVNEWADNHATNNKIDLRNSVRTILSHLVFIEQKLYCQYEPSQPPNPGYWQRLSDWLDNLKFDSDQEIAFNLAAKLFFVGRDEIKAMYRTAYYGPIMRWLIKLESLQLNDINLGLNLNTLLEDTWFCPITDSLKINEFCHINNIPTRINERPDWHSLVKLGNPDEIRKLINDNNVERIVLLEDFIATGTQAAKAIKLAANVCPNNPLPVLIVPLIMCPKAIDNFMQMSLPQHVTIEPVLQLEEHHFISIDETKNSDEFKQFKDLAETTYLQVTAGIPKQQGVKPYDPLGYGVTGGLLILGTNTPDNTLPLVHWSSASWRPLFPRHSRV